MSKHLANLITVFCRRIPLTATIGPPQNFVPKNSFTRHLQRSCVLAFKHQSYSTSSNAEQESNNEAQTNSTADISESQYICHFRRLPFSTTQEELVNELENAKITVKGGESGVHLFLNKDKPMEMVQAYVELASEFDLDELKASRFLFRGKMPIDVCSADVHRVKQDLQDWSSRNPELDSVLRLDGLPYEWTFEELKEFFNGFNVEIAEKDVTPVTMSGVVFIRLPSPDVVRRVIEENKPMRYIKDRYIRMRESSTAESETVPALVEEKRQARSEKFKERLGIQDTSSCDSVKLKPELSVFIRGLPYWVGERRIREFFFPFKPETVQIIKNHEGRASGCAYATFKEAADYEEALKKTMSYIESRYIEIFPVKDGW